MAGFTDALDDARIALMSLADKASGMANPTLRLGVTGLSRAGKTIFTTALIHALTQSARMPVFEAAQSGRIAVHGWSRSPMMPCRALPMRRIWPACNRRAPGPNPPRG